MPERSIYSYLSGYTLEHVLADLRHKRAELRFRDAKQLAFGDEYIAVNRMYLTATAEWTARLALDPETRAALAKSEPMTAAEFAKVALGPAKRLREMADKLEASDNG